MLLERLLTRRYHCWRNITFSTDDLPRYRHCGGLHPATRQDRRAMNDYLIPLLREMAESRTGCQVTYRQRVNFAALAEYRLRHKESRRLFLHHL